MHRLPPADHALALAGNAAAGQVDVGGRRFVADPTSAVARCCDASRAGASEGSENGVTCVGVEVNHPLGKLEAGRGPGEPAFGRFRLDLPDQAWRS